MRCNNFLLSIALVAINLFSGCTQSFHSKIEQEDGDRLASFKMYNAIYADNIALVEEALAMGEDPNRFSCADVVWISPTGKRERSPFAMSVYSDSYASAELLLKNGADVNAITVDGAVPLQIVNIEFAKKMIDFGADVTLKNANGQDTFEYAVSRFESRRALEWVELCVENGCVITQEKIKRCFDDNDNKPYEVIKYLRKHIPDLHMVLSDTDALFYKGAFETLESDEADINIRNSRGETLINIAAKYGNMANVRLLYEKGADIRICGNNGLYDAMDYAIENGHVQIVQYLAEKGENVIPRDDFLYSTTTRNLINCVKGGHDDCVQYVLANFRDIYNKKDVTAAAQEAIRMNNGELLKMILNNYKYSMDELLVDCTMYGTVEIAQIMMEYGADFGGCDNALFNAVLFHEYDDGAKLTSFLLKNYPNLLDSNSPGIPEAINKGNIECVKLLIEGGINVNRKYYDKQMTALMCAADSTDEIFKYLLSKGADVSLTDAEGKTVESYLNYNGCSDNNKIVMLTCNAES